MKNEMIIDLDFAWDFALGDFMIELNEFNINIEKFIGDGPGGGNPNIFLRGNRDDLIGYLKKYHHMDDENISYYMGD